MSWVESDPSNYYRYLQDWDLDEYAKTMQKRGASDLAQEIQAARARYARLATEKN